LSADNVEDPDEDEKSFGFSNSNHVKTEEEINQNSVVRIDFDLQQNIEDKEIKIDFTKGNQDSNNSNFSENVTSEKNLYDLMGSIKDQI
jgi:hypothetical protein